MVSAKGLSIGKKYANVVDRLLDGPHNPLPPDVHVLLIPSRPWARVGAADNF